MIQGTKVNLRMFHSEKEIKIVNDIFCDLKERSSLDHTEIYFNINLVKEFNNSSLREHNIWKIIDHFKNNTIIGTINF